MHWKKDKIVPFMIFVYKKEDPSDIDYIMLQRLNMIGEELVTFIREHLRIYIVEKTNCIHYACLTKMKEIQGPVKQIKVTDGIGRSATITIWKTLLAKTIRKKKTSHVKSKKGDQVKEETKQNQTEEV